MGLRADRSGSKTAWTAEACVAAAWACQAAAVALRDGTSICGAERAAVVQIADPLGAVNTEPGKLLSRAPREDESVYCS